MERFIYHGTKKLRCGYTTGSCAAAAAKAAAQMLLTQTAVRLAELTTPSGVKLSLDVSDIKMSPDSVSCAVIKDSGDDPDITDGIKVCAEVSLIPDGVKITGGEGIGRVTLPGLDQPVGEAAINSVPREMISRAVSETAGLYGYGGGFRIVISVPGGEELAKRTFNPRLGIVGGISIIGTTGIVEPMSDSAIIETIRTEANMRRAAGDKTLLLAVGNYSERFIGDSEPDIGKRCVICSNFIGNAVDIGVSLGFERILVVGHIGKLVKLGSGIMNTHSSAADGRMETLIACAALSGADADILKRIDGCVTTDAALDVLYESEYAERTLEILAGRAEHYLKGRVKNAAEIGAVIFSLKRGLLVKTAAADGIIKAAMEE